MGKSDLQHLCETYRYILHVLDEVCPVNFGPFRENSLELADPLLVRFIKLINRAVLMEMKLIDYFADQTKREEEVRLIDLIEMVLPVIGSKQNVRLHGLLKW